MIITDIIKQKKYDRYNIIIDGNFKFSASIEEIIKYSLKENMEIRESQLNQLIEECESLKAYNYALYLLGNKDYTMSEIIEKLKQKEYSEEAINKITYKLKGYGMVDDERYTKKYINDCLNFKKYGSKKILFNLKTKGIDQEVINKTSISNETQYINAYSLALKKLKSLGDKQGKKEKIFRYLLSKGYEYDLINKVLQEIFNDF